ncbi:MAG: hypothetical protein C0501_28205 [Isosphaera sp.]|nr:hypothetical protein [Isosphaera sp.]
MLSTIPGADPMDLRAVIFMPALTGAVVFGFVFLLYACHYYLTVLESAAAGGDEVPWASEAVTDHFWKLWYLGFLVGMWLGPALIVGRAVAGPGAGWVQFAVPLGVLWLCYPVSQLSSLSASSVWYPLVPDVFARLARKPVLAAQFFLLSGVVLVAFGFGFRWAFQTAGEWHLLPVGAVVVAVAGLVYGRLLGRLAFALRFTRGLSVGRKKAAKKPPEPAKEADTPAAEPTQPRDLPPVVTPDEGALTGYDVEYGDQPAAKRKRVRAVADDGEDAASPPTPADAGDEASPPARRNGLWTEEDEDRSAYGVREAEVVSGGPVPEAVAKPSAAEARLYDRSDRPRKPRRVWGPEVATFLGQPGTVSAVLILSVLGSVVGLMVRVARAYNPVGGG